MSTTRWLSMHQVSRWFKQHRIRINEYLIQRDKTELISNNWWILLYVVDNIAQEASYIVKDLQNKSIFLDQQSKLLNKLKCIYINFIQAELIDLEVI